MSATVSHPKMSDKNTKQELLENYHRLLAELENQPVESEKTPEVTQAPALDTVPLLRGLADLRLALGGRLESIAQELEQEIGGYRDTVQKLGKQKEELLAHHKEQVKRLSEEYEQAKTQLESEQVKWRQERDEERRQQEAARRREEEEYGYSVSSQRRKEEDNYAEKRAKQERELAAREQVVQEQEAEFQRLQTELSAVGERQALLVKQAVDEVKKELERNHTTEVREMNLKSDHEQKMAELRISGLEQQNKSLLTEIESLKRQLGEASRQMKDMAVTVIEGRSASKATSTQVTADTVQAN